MHTNFMAELKALLTHKTRITQKKGLLFGSFVCDFNENGLWKSVGGTSYFRFGGFHPPSINGGVQEYISNAIFSET